MSVLKDLRTYSNDFAESWHKIFLETFKFTKVCYANSSSFSMILETLVNISITAVARKIEPKSTENIRQIFEDIKTSIKYLYYKWPVITSLVKD